MIQKRNVGFTIVELMLSIAFISFLLLSIALLAIQVGRIYQRGLTLQTINQSGREISDMIRRDFLQARAPHITKATVDRAGETVGGRVCLGDYSYVWNTISAMQKYASNDSSITTINGKSINLARVADPGGQLCSKDAAGRYQKEIDQSKATHILQAKEGSEVPVIGVYTMTADPIIKEQRAISQGVSDEALYIVQFTLGTSAAQEINTSSATCKPPDEADLEYCAINKFEVVARTNG